MAILIARIVKATIGAIAVFVSLHTLAFAQQNDQLRLTDGLDMPSEGYCIDVVGAGGNIRTDLPLVVHNCLPNAPVPDRNVVFRLDGTIYFPAFKKCATVFGVNGVLPGSPLMLADCGVRQPFLNAQRLQTFVPSDDGQLQLENSTLCLSAGSEAAPTYSPVHRWRTLSMQPCDEISGPLSHWDLPN